MNTPGYLRAVLRETIDTFPVAPNFPLLGRPTSVAVGDLNGDGIDDLVTINVDNVLRGTLSVLLGNGDGTFRPAHTSPIGSSPASIALAELDGDGILDLVVTNNVSNGTVMVLLGIGDGTFQSPRTIALAGGRPFGVAVEDFNRDGIPDLAVTVGDGVSVLLGNGDGTFQVPRNIALGAPAGAIAARDLNRDGKPDLVVATDASQMSGMVSVLVGNGDGTFQAPQAFAAGGFPTSVAVGDFNGDGMFDIAVANTPEGGVATMSVLLGNGDGTFQAPRSFPAGRSPTDFSSFIRFSPQLLAVADFNRDGVDDLAMVSNAGIRLLLGDRAGNFETFSFSYNTGAGSRSVAMGDFNGDGFADLAVANNGTNTVFILLNDTVWP